MNIKRTLAPVAISLGLIASAPTPVKAMFSSDLSDPALAMEKCVVNLARSKDAGTLINWPASPEGNTDGITVSWTLTNINSDGWAYCDLKATRNGIWGTMHYKTKVLNGLAYAVFLGAENSLGQEFHPLGSSPLAPSYDDFKSPQP
jgi:hypothetical protein